MEIRTHSLRFWGHKGSGPRENSRDINFTNAPTQATAIMTGFKAAFSKSDGDHELGNLDIRLDTTIIGAVVRVKATFGLRDWSGSWDDRYEGEVFFAVIGE